MKKRDIRRNEELKLRSIQMNLSDRDLLQLAEKCGRSGISIQDLFEIFVGDLIGGTFYSGSDESVLANQWYERHGFSWMNEGELLSHILKQGDAAEVVDFLESWDEVAYLKDHPDEAGPEDQWLHDGIEDTLEGFEREVTEEDIKKVREWVNEYGRIWGTK